MKEEIFNSVSYRSLKVEDQSLQKDERIPSFLSRLDASRLLEKMNHYREGFVCDLHG